MFKSELDDLSEFQQSRPPDDFKTHIESHPGPDYNLRWLGPIENFLSHLPEFTGWFPAQFDLAPDILRGDVVFINAHYLSDHVNPDHRTVILTPDNRRFEVVPFHVAEEIEALRFIFLGEKACVAAPPILGIINAVLGWEGARRAQCDF